jgi:dual specificity MAP kinase phosphatase
VASTPNCIESYENEPPTQVLPFLYVGNARDSTDRELLKKLGIRFILSVTTNSPNSYHTNSTTCTNDSTNSENNHQEFRRKLIPVSDNLCENLAPYFDDAYEFIEEARKSGSSILIHCHAGISRSPTIAIAYIMKHINLSTLEAYAFVQRYRRIISPNLNFMGQLVEFESKLKGVASHSTESSTESISSVDSCSGSSVDCDGNVGSGEYHHHSSSLNVTPMIIAD